MVRLSALGNINQVHVSKNPEGLIEIQCIFIFFIVIICIYITVMNNLLLCHEITGKRSIIRKMLVIQIYCIAFKVCPFQNNTPSQRMGNHQKKIEIHFPLT